MILSQQFYSEVERLFTRYPKKVHALLPILYLAQKENGFLSDEIINEISSLCEVSKTHVNGVITFYTMFFNQKIGKCSISVCGNFACYIKGAEKILHHIEKKLDIETGGSTDDYQFYLEEVECLGSCHTAPVALIDEQLVENLTLDKIDKIIAQKEKTS